QRSIEIAERLLAHATVARGSASQRALDTKPYGTALAPAGVDRLVVQSHRFNSLKRGQYPVDSLTVSLATLLRNFRVVTDCLDVVAVPIDHEGAIVVLVVVRARSRSAIVAPSGS